MKTLLSRLPAARLPRLRAVRLPRLGAPRGPSSRSRAFVGGVAALATVAVVLGVAGVVVMRGTTYDRIVAASERTVEAGTARVAMTTVMDGGIGQPTQRLDMGGVMDFATGASQIEVRLGEPSLAGDPTAGGLPIVVMTDGTDTFMQVAGSGELPWTLLPPEEPATGDVTGNAIEFGTLLGTLGRGLQELEEVGEDDVRGAETTRYRATFDLARAAERAPEDQRPTLQALSDQQAGDSMTMDLWVDDDYVRRLTYTVDLDAGTGTEAAAGGGEEVAAAGAPLPPGATMTIAVEYYDFGIPVDVSRPANVIDMDGNPIESSPESTPTEEEGGDDPADDTEPTAPESAPEEPAEPEPSAPESGEADPEE